MEGLSGLWGELVRPFSSTRGIVMLAFTLSGVGLVIWASFVRTMMPLRALTVGSNVLLLVGAILAPEPANIVLYLVLIPVNAWRLVEIRRLTQQVDAATGAGDVKGLWLKPYMRTHKLKAGAMLFSKGDPADSIHLLVSGKLELVEIGKRQPAGEIFGEISFFSPERTRTLTARCVTDCVVLGIAEDMFKQLYFQNPSLAFQVSNLIAHRLSADIQRLREQVVGLEQAVVLKPTPAVPEAPVAQPVLDQVA